MVANIDPVECQKVKEVEIFPSLEVSGECRGSSFASFFGEFEAGQRKFGLSG